MDLTRHEMDEQRVDFLRLLEGHRDRAHQLLRTQVEQIHKFDQALNEQMLLLTVEVAERQAAVSQTIPANDRESLPEDVQELVEHYGQYREQLEAWENRLQDFEAQLEQRELDATQREQAASDQAGHHESPPDSGKLWLELEDAKEEIEDLRQRNHELTTRLQAGQQGVSPPEDGDSEDFDWGAQRSRMLASLESESEPVDRETKLDVQEAIQKTDQIVAQKEAEIENLKKLLHQQSGNIGSVAVGATAISELLDQDELIRQERENLQQLQDEWQQKVRQAEIDTSLERARIARERSELLGRVHTLEGVLVRHGIDMAAIDKAKLVSPSGGRWRAELGIQDDEAD